MKRFALLLSLMSAVLLAAGTGQGQPYPSKVVRVIVGFPPGQATDLAARLLAEKMSALLGQQVIVDNQPGQAGSIAASALAKAPTDGHTMMLAATASLVINPHLYKNVTYDALKDFMPIGLVVEGPMMLVVSPGLPVNSVAELIAYAKASPGKLNYASAGNGSMSHLAMAMFMQEAGIALTHVPYQGSPKAIADVMNGNVQVMFDTVAVTQPQIEARKLKVLATGSPVRLRLFPDVPTIKELGFPRFDATPWVGLLFPSGTPPAMVERVNQALNEALRSPDVSARFQSMGLFPRTGTPEEFAATLRADNERWSRVVRDVGVKVE